MILEKNNLQTAPEWTKSYIELIASHVHPKTGNRLRSHLLRAIMTLDHRRLIRPGTRFRPNFLRSTSLLYKILLTNLGACKPTLYIIYTSHLRWNSTMRHIIKTLLCLFSILKWFNARHFEYSCKRCSLNDWKQTAQRLKLQERLLTINKRNIIRWNIYRDDNFHSGRQVLKCL